MKSVKNDNTNDITYPCLMEGDSGTLVLMTDRAIGVTINADHQTVNKVGEYRTDWCSNAFTPYTGTVTLSN